MNIDILYALFAASYPAVSVKGQKGKKYSVVKMSQPIVCSNRLLLIRGSSVEAVVAAVNTALQNMGLKIKKSETFKGGKSSIFAAEGAWLPIILRILTFPLAFKDYTQSAQRGGIHLIVAPSDQGVGVNVCGLALDEITGRPEKYPEPSMEEVTDTLKSLDFEEKFINNLRISFPDLEVLS